MSTSRAFALLPFGLIALGLVAACSSSSSGSGSGTTEDTKPAEPAPAATTPEAPAPAPTAPPKKDPPPAAPAGECSSETTQTGCVTCCSNKHQDGAGVYFVALIDCMCVADLCAKDCESTLCDANNPQNADSACQACVQAKSGKCSTPIKTACQADPDCVAFDACAGQSDCPGKTN